MDLAEVRRLTITAMFSDDSLMEQLVLKGGNALSLVYGLGARTSLDVDLSIDGDFADFEDARTRIVRTLQKRFGAAGYAVFDERFERRPAVEDPRADKEWGGYILEFKLIEEQKHRELQLDIDASRRNALVTGPLQRKTFTIDFSKYEFCRGKAEAQLDDYTIYVYTPEMIVIEKLRALCQQMPEYQRRLKKAGRARDFYDIFILITQAHVDLSRRENLELARNVFAAKDVPLKLIQHIVETKEQHRPDWPSVQASVAGSLKSFDDYFSFVVEQTQALKSLWIE